MRRVPVGLWLAAAVGLGVRWFGIFVAKPSCANRGDLDCFQIGGDVLFVEQQGELIADGQWYKSGFEWWAFGLVNDSASRPPLFPLLIGLISKLGIRSDDAQRGIVAALSVVSIVLIGLVARRLAGDRAAVIAGFVAALHPLMWIGDIMMMSEALYVPFIAGIILAAYRYLDAPSLGRLLGLAALMTLAGLVRSEGLLLLGLLLVPVVIRTNPRNRERLIGIGASALVSLAILAPWLAFNNARFAEPVTVTSSTGWVLFAGACDPAWQGQYIGYWAAGCLEERGLADDFDERFPGQRLLGEDRVLYDESEIDGWYRDRAIEYYRTNAGQFPVVAAARMGRTLEVFNAGQGLWLDYQIEGRWKLPSTLGLAGYYLLVPLSFVGVRVLRRRGESLLPLLIMWPLILSTVVFTYGITRYRIPIDVAMVILGAVAVDALSRKLLESRMQQRERPPGKPHVPGVSEVSEVQGV